MRARLGAAVLAPLLAAGLILGTPTGASADSTTRADAVGDSEVVIFDSNSADEVIATDPDERLTDIERVRFDYRRQFLVVTAHLRDVRGNIGQSKVRVKAGDRRYSLVRVNKEKVNVERVGPGSGFRPCTGGTAVSDGARDTVRFRVPVRCIDAPAAARFRFDITRSTSTPQDLRSWSDQTSGYTARVSRG